MHYWRFAWRKTNAVPQQEWTHNTLLAGCYWSQIKHTMGHLSCCLHMVAAEQLCNHYTRRGRVDCSFTYKGRGFGGVSFRANYTSTPYDQRFVEPWPTHTYVLAEDPITSPFAVIITYTHLGRLCSRFWSLAVGICAHPAICQFSSSFQRYPVGLR